MSNIWKSTYLWTKEWPCSYVDMPQNFTVIEHQLVEIDVVNLYDGSQAMDTQELL